MTTTPIKRTTEYDVEQIIDSIVLAFSSDPQPSQGVVSQKNWFSIIETFLSKLTQVINNYYQLELDREGKVKEKT